MMVKTRKKYLKINIHLRCERKMNKKILNVANVVLSFIILIDVLLISSTVIFDIPSTSYQKILIFDIFTCSILFIDFFNGFYRTNNRKQYFRRNWIKLMAAIPLDVMFLPFLPLGYLKLIRLVRILFLIGEYLILRARKSVTVKSNMELYLLKHQPETLQYRFHQPHYLMTMQATGLLQ